jgi:hypothetical protein
MWDLRFSQGWLWRVSSSGTWRCVVRRVFSDPEDGGDMFLRNVGLKLYDTLQRTCFEDAVLLWPPNLNEAWWKSINPFSFLERPIPGATHEAYFPIARTHFVLWRYYSYIYVIQSNMQFSWCGRALRWCVWPRVPGLLQYIPTGLQFTMSLGIQWPFWWVFHLQM